MYIYTRKLIALGLAFAFLNKHLTYGARRANVKSASANLYIFLGDLAKKSVYHLLILSNLIGSVPLAQAQEDFTLPTPGQMMNLSQAFKPVTMRGLRIDPLKPFSFNFLVDEGDAHLNEKDFKDEASRAIKYFLTSLTIPDEDLWVNLSPYEKNRIIPNEFGQTQMGRDLLAQDYILKQITASLIYPEKELGKKFWDKIYKLAQEKYGTTNIPVNTFNKVWIVPNHATVFEKKETAFVVDYHLKVMLEEDYVSMNINVGVGSKPTLKHRAGLDAPTETNQIGSQIVREIVLPALETEVNQGQNFANLRQIFYSLILATWYKQKIKNSILAKIYVDQKKMVGIDGVNDTESIYQKYLQAFKKGVYNYIKEEPDLITGQMTPRKYFSGGMKAHIDSKNMAMVSALPDGAMKSFNFKEVSGDFALISNKSVQAMSEQNPTPIQPAAGDHNAAMDVADSAMRIDSKKFIFKDEKEMLVHLTGSEKGSYAEFIATLEDFVIPRSAIRSGAGLSHLFRGIRANRQFLRKIVKEGLGPSEFFGGNWGSYDLIDALIKSFQPHVNLVPTSTDRPMEDFLAIVIEYKRQSSFTGHIGLKNIVAIWAYDKTLRKLVNIKDQAMNTPAQPATDKSDAAMGSEDDFKPKHPNPHNFSGRYERMIDWLRSPLNTVLPIEQLNEATVVDVGTSKGYGLIDIANAFKAEAPSADFIGVDVGPQVGQAVFDMKVTFPDRVHFYKDDHQLNRLKSSGLVTHPIKMIFAMNFLFEKPGYLDSPQAAGTNVLAQMLRDSDAFYSSDQSKQMIKEMGNNMEEGLLVTGVVNPLTGLSYILIQQKINGILVPRTALIGTEEWRLHGLDRISVYVPDQWHEDSTFEEKYFGRNSKKDLSTSGQVQKFGEDFVAINFQIDQQLKAKDSKPRIDTAMVTSFPRSKFVDISEWESKFGGQGTVYFFGKRVIKVFNKLKISPSKIHLDRLLELVTVLHERLGDHIVKPIQVLPVIINGQTYWGIEFEKVEGESPEDFNTRDLGESYRILNLIDSITGLSDRHERMPGSPLNYIRISTGKLVNIDPINMQLLMLKMAYNFKLNQLIKSYIERLSQTDLTRDDKLQLVNERLQLIHYLSTKVMSGDYEVERLTSLVWEEYVNLMNASNGETFIKREKQNISKVIKKTIELWTPRIKADKPDAAMNGDDSTGVWQVDAIVETIREGDLLVKDELAITAYYHKDERWHRTIAGTEFTMGHFVMPSNNVLKEHPDKWLIIVDGEHVKVVQVSEYLEEDPRLEYISSELGEVYWNPDEFVFVTTAADHAMKVRAGGPGGIDLSSKHYQLTIKTDGIERSVDFDPAKFKDLQFDGLEFKINRIKNIIDPQAFLIGI